MAGKILTILEPKPAERNAKGDDSSSDSSSEEKRRGRRNISNKILTAMPYGISTKCEEFIESLLLQSAEDDEDPFRHPFLSKSLRKIPPLWVKTVQATLPVDKDSRLQDDKDSQGVSAGETDITLVSALKSARSMSTANESMETKRTPFGILRIAKKGRNCATNTEKELHAHQRPFGDLRGSCDETHSTRWLRPVRQRTKKGLIEVDARGNVTLSTDKGTIMLTSDGKLECIGQDIGGVYMKTSHAEMLQWIQRRSRRSVLCTFAMPSWWPDRNASPHLADNLAECRVMANGPLPDYTVTFHVSPKYETRCSEQLHIRVEQSRKCLLLVSSIESKNHSPTILDWRQCVLSLNRGDMSSNNSYWKLADSLELSQILCGLSEKHVRAIDRSLAAASTVNSIFQAAINQDSFARKPAEKASAKIHQES